MVEIGGYGLPIRGVWVVRQLGVHQLVYLHDFGLGVFEVIVDLSTMTRPEHLQDGIKCRIDPA